MGEKKKQKKKNTNMEFLHRQATEEPLQEVPRCRQGQGSQEGQELNAFSRWKLDWLNGKAVVVGLGCGQGLGTIAMEKMIMIMAALVWGCMIGITCANGPLVSISVFRTAGASTYAMLPPFDYHTRGKPTLVTI